MAAERCCSTATATSLRTSCCPLSTTSLRPAPRKATPRRRAAARRGTLACTSPTTSPPRWMASAPWWCGTTGLAQASSPRRSTDSHARPAAPTSSLTGLPSFWPRPCLSADECYFTASCDQLGQSAGAGVGPAVFPWRQQQHQRGSWRQPCNRRSRPGRNIGRLWWYWGRSRDPCGATHLYGTLGEHDCAVRVRLLHYRRRLRRQHVAAAAWRPRQAGLLPQGPVFVGGL